jgi:hypothetical protein
MHVPQYSPSFLLQNKQKLIQSSAVTNKHRDWQRSVKNERDLYQMGPEAFYEPATHSESKKLIIHLMQQQDEIARGSNMTMPEMTTTVVEQFNCLLCPKSSKCYVTRPSNFPNGPCFNRAS